MAKRKGRRRRAKPPVETVDYTDTEGNVLTLRKSLTPGTVAAIKRAASGGSATAEDDWQRRSEMLFERLAVSWVIAEVPLSDQKTLLGRYRIAGSEERAWVRETISAHLAEHLPELAG